jgi:hypothetical protein
MAACVPTGNYWWQSAAYAAVNGLFIALVVDGVIENPELGLLFFGLVLPVFAAGVIIARGGDGVQYGPVPVICFFALMVVAAILNLYLLVERVAAVGSTIT